MKWNFHETYMPEPMSGCWIWIGRLMARGYGYVGNQKNGQPKAAHRHSWEIYRGPIPDGKHVLHKCDVRCCVNPDHLYIGTQKDNNRDRDIRGRNGMAKLSRADIPEIRRLLAEGETTQQVADKYGVDRSNISHIQRGATWRHV